MTSSLRPGKPSGASGRSTSLSVRGAAPASERRDRRDQRRRSRCPCTAAASGVETGSRSELVTSGSGHGTPRRSTRSIRRQKAVQRFPLDGKVVSDLAVDTQGASVGIRVCGGRCSRDCSAGPGNRTGNAGQELRARLVGWALRDGRHGQVTLERRVEGATVKGGTLTQIIPGTAAPVDVGGSFALPVTDGTSLWTPFFGDRTAMNLSSGIARVDPATGEVLDEWKTGSVGYDLAVGADGGVWFLAGQHLQRLNPATGEIDVKATVEGDADLPHACRTMGCGSKPTKETWCSSRSPVDPRRRSSPTSSA